MRIAIFAPSFPPLASGGVSSSHYNLYMSMKKRFFVKVFTYDETARSTIEEHDIYRYGLPAFLTRSLRFAVTILLRFFGARGAIYQCCDALCGALAGLMIFSEVRSFQPDILIVPDHGPVSAFWPRLVNARTIFVSHHNSMRFHDHPVFGPHSRNDALLGKWFEQRAIDNSDAVIVPSSYMKDMFQETYEFNGPIKVIANMLDGKCMESTPAASLHVKMQLSANAPIVYIPSASSIYKGRNFILDIVNRLSLGYAGEIGFYLSGAIDAQFIDSFASLPSHVKVYAPGPVSYHENISNMKACKICVSPSLLESFGMAILEAQWNGIPVVAFDTGGIREIVIDGKTGYLCPYLDQDTLVLKALTLLLNSKLLDNIIRQTVELTHSRFNESEIIEQYIGLFGQITESK